MCNYYDADAQLKDEKWRIETLRKESKEYKTEQATKVLASNPTSGS